MTKSILNKFKERNFVIGLIIALAVLIMIGFYKPAVLVEGLQRSALYALIALPMALLLGIVDIINLAHGEFMMLGAYLAYFLSWQFGIDPMVAVIPAIVFFFIFGLIIYFISFKHIIGTLPINQLLLGFGISLIFSEGITAIATNAPRKLSLDYVSSSATIGNFTFGTFEFVYVAAALIVFIGLQLFLKKTATGQAAVAVGQNPRGARIVGINVNNIYLLIFCISITIIGAIGPLFMTRYTLFPQMGGAFTLKSFSLVAVGGMGSITGVVYAALILGMGEALVLSSLQYGKWAEIIYFALIIGVIMYRSHQRQVK
ncbi:MAG: branched-chain amino acid ABC transporter permease [Deltaproteobacteria bacterium HGW-Deltaproteobacteria-12]|jgi:branched-chain amino acid transport system permease protein|nr:MAG: branched-chain amino acid ABC transporter permease [Deltaproteobacteria bacterium HGW-Deltaproteobacteria-12]